MEWWYDFDHVGPFSCSLISNYLTLCFCWLLFTGILAVEAFEIFLTSSGYRDVRSLMLWIWQILIWYFYLLLCLHVVFTSMFELFLPQCWVFQIFLEMVQVVENFVLLLILWLYLFSSSNDIILQSSFLFSFPR